MCARTTIAMGVGSVEILLLRHGKTRGNLERRYVGRTDEPLLPSAAAELARSEYRNFCPELVYTSPMLRCRQTAEILFPECADGKKKTHRQKQEPAGSVCRECTGITGDRRKSELCETVDGRGCRLVICSGLRETDFGVFENKTYDDLKNDPAYQAWIDSGGAIAAPGGESGADFRMRCRREFLACLRHAEMGSIQKIAFVAHGGVIMSIMEAFARPRGDFYSWQLPNGSAYRVRAMKGDSTWFLVNL
ncbi:MAG: histidine phosphatase family protein [Lachnospiraceae bacterium]|nr:histidine phosphatase family protein [Lachnospiraceae bacterium]